MCIRDSISSADWMPRNFFRRVEVMVPIEAPALVQRILQEIMPVYLADNTRARAMDAAGAFHLPHPVQGEAAVRCQQMFMEEPAEAQPAVQGETVADKESTGAESAGADPLAAASVARRPRRAPRR